MRISDWSSDVCSSDLHGRKFRILGIADHHWPSTVDHAQKDSLAAQSGQAVLQIIAVEPDGKILGRIMLGGDTEGRHDIAGGKDAADQIGRASCRERVCQYV